LAAILLPLAVWFLFARALLKIQPYLQTELSDAHEFDLSGDSL
jgi:hypothetical protein